MDNLANYAQVLKNICENRTLGKKAVQKLMYLIERKGVDLELGYTIHFFGPYSSKLDNILHILQNEELIEINTQGVTHTISIKDVDFNMKHLSKDEKEKVAFVLDRFGNKTALELEGITTLDFVARSLEPKGKVKVKDEEIIKEVVRIKGQKFSDEQLQSYLKELRELSFLN